MTNLHRLDHVIASLVHARTLVQENVEYDFDLSMVLPQVEVSVTTLVSAVEDEALELGK